MLQIQVSESEHKRLKKFAVDMGVSVAFIVRRLLAGKTIE